MGRGRIWHRWYESIEKCNGNMRSRDQNGNEKRSREGNDSSYKRNENGGGRKYVNINSSYDCTVLHTAKSHTQHTQKWKYARQSLHPSLYYHTGRIYVPWPARYRIRAPHPRRRRSPSLSWTSTPSRHYPAVCRRACSPTHEGLHPHKGSCELLRWEYRMCPPRPRMLPNTI